MEDKKIHDIKHAIYNIRNCLDLLKKELSDKITKETKELIEMAWDEINKAISLLDRYEEK